MAPRVSRSARTIDSHEQQLPWHADSQRRSFLTPGRFTQPHDPTTTRSYDRLIKR